MKFVIICLLLTLTACGKSKQLFDILDKNDNDRIENNLSDTNYNFKETSSNSAQSLFEKLNSSETNNETETEKNVTKSLIAQITEEENKTNNDKSKESSSVLNLVNENKSEQNKLEEIEINRKNSTLTTTNASSSINTSESISNKNKEAQENLSNASKVLTQANNKDEKISISEQIKNEELRKLEKKDRKKKKREQKRKHEEEQINKIKAIENQVKVLLEKNANLQKLLDNNVKKAKVINKNKKDNIVSFIQKVEKKVDEFKKDVSIKSEKLGGEINTKEAEFTRELAKHNKNFNKIAEKITSYENQLASIKKSLGAYLENGNFEADSMIVNYGIKVDGEAHINSISSNDLKVGNSFRISGKKINISNDSKIQIGNDVVVKASDLRENFEELRQLRQKCGGNLAHCIFEIKDSTNKEIITDLRNLKSNLSKR